MYLLMNLDFNMIKTVFIPSLKKGKKVYGEPEKKTRKRENLVVGRRKKLKDLIPPIIFKGSLNALEFEQWLFQHLLPSLKNPSVLLYG